MLIVFFLYWILGGKFIFFTKVESGEMVFVFRGKSLFKIILNVSGKVIEKEQDTGKWKIVDGTQKMSWINKHGYYWTDWSPTANIPTISVKNKYTVKKLEGGEIEIKWTEDEDSTKRGKKSILFLMPFKFSFGNLEGGPVDNAFRVGIEAACQLEVVYPEQAFILLKGHCFEETHSVLETSTQLAVADETKFPEYSALRTADKTERGSFSLYMKEEGGKTNLALLERVGFKLTGFNFTVSTTEAMAEATEAESIAKKKKKAAKQNAQAAALVTRAQLDELDKSTASPIEKAALLLSSALANIFSKK